MHTNDPSFFGKALQRLRRLRSRKRRRREDRQQQQQQQQQQQPPQQRPLSPYDEVNIIQSAFDPLLVEGSTLPKTFGQFPPHLYGKPIEEFDVLIKHRVSFVCVN